MTEFVLLIDISVTIKIINKENTLQNKEKIGIATNYMYTQICEGRKKINLTILKKTFLTIQPAVYNFSIYDCQPVPV